MRPIKKDDKNAIQMQRVSIAEFLLTFLIIAGAAEGQIFISNLYTGPFNLPKSYMIGMGIYLAAITLLLCLYINWERFNTYGKPLSALGKAAYKVANGDFSVRLDLDQKKDGKEFVGYVFNDFNKMVEELGSIETLKNDFISNVSHEIKTPLAIMQNYAAALQDENITAERRREYTDTIIEATRRLNTLVTNILKLSKLDNQKIVPTMEEYDLCGQLADCALSFDEMFEKKNIGFSADMDDRAVVRADKSMLEIVWNNLLTNAVKFTEPGGSISLSQTSDEDTITVTVADTGCGMSEATARRIFDKFYQGDTSHSQEGNGLGLALALRVVELMGGQLTVKSKLGEGTAFTVCLRTAA